MAPGEVFGGADPRAPPAPYLRADLTGPSALLMSLVLPVLTNTAELLLSDSEGLNGRASAAGVDVTLESDEGLANVSPGTVDTPEATSATTDRIGTFLRAEAARPSRDRPVRRRTTSPGTDLDHCPLGLSSPARRARKAAALTRF